MQYISHSNLTSLLDSLQKDFSVYIPEKKGEHRFYSRYEGPSDSIVIGEVRPFEPLKAFFMGAREKVADGFKSEKPVQQDKPFAIVGVKACDLKGFKIQDYVFQENDFKDPFYIKKREETLIISSDCTCAIETCFCLALGVKPYPESDFDINLSPVTNGYVVTVGSEKGQKIVDKNAALFESTTHDVVSEKDKQRNGTVEDVEKNIKDNNIPDQSRFKDVVEKNYESGIWEEEAKACVECGACNTICPTCHCFLLYDQKDEEKMARLRVWDSCMIKDFARVAGGANPRPELWMRLRNRFEKKFDFFPKVADIYACTGCGRCISACPAKIDIRKVLKGLVSNA